MEKKLAIIEKAKLELIDSGILSFSISVKYEDGLCQMIGGLALDSFDKSKDRRVGTAYGCEMIRRLLSEFAVDDFSEMKGAHVWVYGIERSGLIFGVHGIGRLSVDGGGDSRLMFKEVADEFIDTEGVN